MGGDKRGNRKRKMNLRNKKSLRHESLQVRTWRITVDCYGDSVKQLQGVHNGKNGGVTVSNSLSVGKEWEASGKPFRHRIIARDFQKRKFRALATTTPPEGKYNAIRIISF